MKSGFETFESKFNISDLPKWAQNDEYVTWLCERNLGYRIDVLRADTIQYRNFLKKEARRIYLNRSKSDTK